MQEAAGTQLAQEHRSPDRNIMNATKEIDPLIQLFIQRIKSHH